MLRVDRFENLFHLHAARAFHQQQVAGLRGNRARNLPPPRNFRRICAALAGCPASIAALHELLRMPLHAENPVDLSSAAAARPHSRCSSAEDAPSSSISPAARIRRRYPGVAASKRVELIQRRGTRIVGIVDHRKSFFEAHHFAALVRGLQAPETPSALPPRQCPRRSPPPAPRARSSRCGGRSAAESAARGRPATRNQTPLPSMPRSSMASARKSRRRAGPKENHRPARNLREARHALVIRIQNGGRVRPRQIFDQLALGQRNLVDRGEKFQMLDRHARDHAHVRATQSAPDARARRDATSPAPRRPLRTRHRASAASAAGRTRCSGCPASSVRGTARQQRRQNFLRCGLSHRPGHAGDAPPRPLPAARSRTPREASVAEPASVSSTANSAPRISSGYSARRSRATNPAAAPASRAPATKSCPS